jgi:16S rRNA (cytidine1402-2'-O)-methyltransferase
MNSPGGSLVLVATPIGNVEDFSPRAIRTLQEADAVYAEDTRHSRRLLERVGAARPLLSCHDHNEARRAEEIVQRLEEGQTVALLSDAGMPTVADPGFRVVRAAHAAGAKVSCVPGPSSIVAALAISGFASDRFVFEGWLPRRSGQLRARLESWTEEARTVVVLESTHRLLKSLPLFAEVLPTRRLAVCRELTKLHEECRRGLAAELLEHYSARPPKGELVLVLEGSVA